MMPRHVSSAGPVLFATVLLAAGCSTSTYEMKLDAIAKPGATEAQSYRIKSKNSNLGEESLRYKEAAELVKTALSGNGMYEAASDTTADVIVELDYGIDSPRTRMERVRVRVYSQASGAHGGAVRLPQAEYVGYYDEMRLVTTYEKYLRLTARENKSASEGKPPAELWNVQVSAEDQSHDLRKYLPLMIAASVDYIDADTGRQKVVKVRDPSPGLEFIQRGITASMAPTETPLGTSPRN